MLVFSTNGKKKLAEEEILRKLNKEGVVIGLRLSDHEMQNLARLIRIISAFRRPVTISVRTVNGTNYVNIGGEIIAGLYLSIGEDITAEKCECDQLVATNENLADAFARLLEENALPEIEEVFIPILKNK